MDDKNKDNAGSGDAAPKSHSAFPGSRGPAREGASAENSPMPSQPRSFVPNNPRPEAAPSASVPPASSPAPVKPTSAGNAGAHDLSKLHEKPKISTPAPGSSAPETGRFPAAPAKSATAGASRPSATAPSAKSSASVSSSFPGKSASVAPAAAAAVAAASTAGAGAAPSAGAARPQSSGAGGDTIPLRINPRPQSRGFNTAAGRGLRQRLPDIRRKSSGPAAGTTVRYGPIGLFFGFIWLIFKMVFFTLLVMGLAAVIGYGALMVYIRTPEVTVPSVAGMKINEAFEVLSDKKLGVRKVGEESSGLVAPGEIISQQPPAGSTAKEGASVGLVLSSGRSRYVVPSVVNENRENAMNKIRGAGLEVGEILALEDANVPREHVISQTPIGGTGLDEPGKVDLMVSSGPPGLSLVMRDFTGRSVAEAKAGLKVVGITDIEVQPANASDAEVVTSQEPLVGKSIFQSDKVVLKTKAAE